MNILTVSSSNTFSEEMVFKRSHRMVGARGAPGYEKRMST
jgi:hypothetical protein